LVIPGMPLLLAAARYVELNPLRAGLVANAAEIAIPIPSPGNRLV